ncbi:fasciclin-3-like isoform X2 [Uranotaenia lowii]|uniref:fasciclin-3-like isoform X2 n=1 Tax=Uranotaenia lowii TaxID=190385 RepID=UPI00247A4C5A|nr:fasciclin-3-like isoform X2 [Uranotaenia lowii]
MVDKQQFFLPCFVVCAFFSAVITAQGIQVDTDPRSIIVTENQRNVSLLCRVGRPVEFCTFILPNRANQIVLRPGDPPRDGLQYFGGGFERGACGITIDRIVASHNGPFKCSLFVDGSSADGQIDVVVAVAPQLPSIETLNDANNLQVDAQLVARCVTRGGNPGATLTWFLDDEPIYQGVSTQQEVQEEGYDTPSQILELSRFIHADDSGRNLVCEAKHQAYPDGVSRTRLPINVNFPPQYLPETTVHGLTLGRTVEVTVMIRAKPAPSVMWTVDGLTIEQGHQIDRYEAPIPVPLGNGAYNVTLIIANLQLEDLSRTYRLKAFNQVGDQDYTILLSSLEAEVDESSGVGIGGIIGIVLAALIVLAAVALIIVARATGRWCFRGKSSSTTTSNARIGETDTTDDRGGVGEQLLSTDFSGTPAADPPTPETALEMENRVYNETTIPILMRPKNLRNLDLLQHQLPRRESNQTDNSSLYSRESSQIGDPNQVGLPVVNKNRWIPSQQRELLEKQANLLKAGANIRRKRETEIF